MTIKIKSETLRDAYRMSLINTGHYNPSSVYEMTDTELLIEYRRVRKRVRQQIPVSWYIEQLLPYGYKLIALAALSSSDLIDLYHQYFPVEEF